MDFTHIMYCVLQSCLWKKEWVLHPIEICNEQILAGFWYKAETISSIAILLISNDSYSCIVSLKVLLS